MKRFEGQVMLITGAAQGIGRRLAERAGSGSIQTNETDLRIGRISTGAARFRGSIHEVRVAAAPLSDAWIETEYRNLVDSAGFIRVGPEERV